MENHLEPPWDELRGQQVQIYRRGLLVRTGYVEDVTHAGDGLWLEQWGIDLRTLYTHTDGFSVHTLPDGLVDAP
ncbi:hypothetical protein D7Z96_19660 [Pseudarthrobacter phenanthrenivorans]|uniref:Uncharacterized protein n=1 Tax=Pseudarthrobacter phenanthrenivorans TaxID=361575 RepID=A0A3B0FEM0_PSEPS|nr:hypothetical protein D7Z96_19660 [Pseudarthrobacter phenanthrenivorans]